MKNQNFFSRILTNYSQTFFNSNAPTGLLFESFTLILYHLQRLSVIMSSSNLNFIPRTKLYGLLGHILRVFQVGFWTEVTPIPYEGFVVIFFVIIGVQIIPYVVFLVFTWKKRNVPTIVEIPVVYCALILNRYLLYLPIYESSYYVIFNLRAKTPFYGLATFNLAAMAFFKVLPSILSDRSAYSRPKFLAQYHNRESIENIGFLIMVGYAMSNYQTGSMGPTYLMISLSCLHLAISLTYPRYLIPVLKHIDLFSHSFCFGFSLLLMLQSTSYKGSGTEFPFLLVTSLLYGFMKNIDRWHRRRILRMFEQSNSLKTTMKHLPFIYEEYMQASKNDEIIHMIYPLLARRNNAHEEAPIFSSEDFSLEAVPLKHKAKKAFVGFISKTYDDYFGSPNVYRSGVQSNILTYLFFTRNVLKDNLKVLFLIHDFRRKLKAKQLSFGWILSIQVARLEKLCTEEYFSLKAETVLDASRVFTVLKQAEELIVDMNSWIYRKISFFEELKAQVVNLQAVKEKGSKLIKDSKAFLRRLECQKELLEFSKVKNSIKYFIEEILQDKDALSFNLKTMFSTSYQASKSSFEELDTFKTIEKLQNNRKNPILLVSAEGSSGTTGKITHSTGYLTQRLGYSQTEIKNLYWKDVLVGFDKTQQQTATNDTKFESKNKNVPQSIHKAILRSRSGEFVVIRHKTQLDVIDSLPCTVFIGQEETISQQKFFLCQKDGLIEGLSKSLAETMPEARKLRGRKFQEFLIGDNPKGFKFEEQDLNSTTARGIMKLDLLSSSQISKSKEFSFMVNRFDSSNLSRECYYQAYIFPKKKTALVEQNGIRSLEKLNSGSPAKFLLESTQQQGLVKDNSISESPADEGIQSAEIELHLVNKNPEEATKNGSPFFNQAVERKLVLAKKSGVSSVARARLISKEPKSDSAINSSKSDNFLPNNSSSKGDETDEQQLNRNRNNMEFKNEQRESSVDGGSYVGGSNRKRAISHIKQTLKRPLLPTAIRFIQLLQIIFCLGLFVYFIADYFDLSRRYVILSELSGLTSFPLQLSWNIYDFLQAEEVFYTCINQLWPPKIRFVWLIVLPPTFNSTYEFFNTQYDEYVLQSNPQSYYSDFSYSNYTIALNLPDSPYLNREVSFQEALEVLRGYMYDLVIAANNPPYLSSNGLNFLHAQNLLYTQMYKNLSDDLFSRLSNQFDALLLSLQLRVLFGAAVALFIGISVTEIFLRLNTYNIQLLSLMIKISESEFLEEIGRLEKSAALLGDGLDHDVLESKPLEPISKKEAQKKYSQAKKYTPPKKGALFKLLFVVSIIGLFLLLHIIGYFVKQDPVTNCVPLLEQYKMLAENAESSISIATQLLDIVVSTYEGNKTQSLSLLNQTQNYFDDAKELSTELSNFIDNEQAVKQNRYISSNLTQAVDSLHNSSFCYLLNDGLLIQSCLTDSNGIASNGIAAEIETNIEWISNFRDQLEAANSPELAANITMDQTFKDISSESYQTSVALGSVTNIYITNFQDIAKTATSTLLILLIVSLAYYVLLLVFALLPLYSWARKQYTEVREIYTLLPVRSLLVNSYIKNILKRNGR